MLKKIEIKYRIKYGICNKDEFKEEIIGFKIEQFDENILFPEMIKLVLKKNKIFPQYMAFVEDLKELTWGKIVSKKFLNFIEVEEWSFDWLNYSLKDIQNVFKLFEQPITILVDIGGFGGDVGEKEGIKFYINSNEKDRHKYDPHVHCKYSGEKTRIRIDNQEIMKGEKGFKNPKKTKIAQKWIKENKKDLLNIYITLNKIENDIYLSGEI